MNATFNYIPIFFIIAALIMAILFFRSQPAAKPGNIVTHLAAFVLLFCVVGMLGAWQVNSPQTYCIILLIAFLFLGFLQVWFMYQFQPWSRTDRFSVEFLFTLLLLLLGGAGYLWVYQWESKETAGWLQAGAILPFLLPFLIHKSIALWKNIPDEIYYFWQYLDTMELPTSIEGEAILLHFRLTKNMYRPSYTRFTVRAPMNMKVSDVFHYFLHHYNQQHPDDPIMANTKNDPFGWYFYTRPAWWKKKEIVNPNISVYRNQLYENVLVYAKRVSLAY